MELKVLRNKIEEIVETNNVVLYDILWTKSGSNKVLQVAIINKDGSMDVDTCQKISEEVSEYLDTVDIQDNYYLEVCSAGAERELRTKEEIQDAINNYIYIKLINPIKDLSEVTGYLKTITEESVNVEYMIKGAKKKVKIDFSNINLIRLAVKV